MSKSTSFEDVMLDPTLKEKSEKVSAILENVWNIGKLTKEEFDTFHRRLLGDILVYRVNHDSCGTEGVQSSA